MNRIAIVIAKHNSRMEKKPRSNYVAGIKVDKININIPQKKLINQISNII